jgi:hypothetical protein
MTSSINFKTAIELLEKRYRKECENYKDVSIEFYTIEVKNFTTDRSGPGMPYSNYYLYASISYNPNIADVVIKFEKVKTDLDIKNDLTSILNELFADEYSVSSIRIPILKSNKIDLDKEISIDLKKVVNNTLIKNIS